MRRPCASSVAIAPSTRGSDSDSSGRSSYCSSRGELTISLARATCSDGTSNLKSKMLPPTSKGSSRFMVESGTKDGMPASCSSPLNISAFHSGPAKTSAHAFDIATVFMTLECSRESRIEVSTREKAHDEIHGDEHQHPERADRRGELRVAVSARNTAQCFDRRKVRRREPQSVRREDRVTRRPVDAARDAFQAREFLVGRSRRGLRQGVGSLQCIGDDLARLVG